MDTKFSGIWPILDAFFTADGRLAVFNGRGGMELPDNFRAGCAGLVPARLGFYPA